MGDSPASYIYMVQHLIEKCLTFHMTKEECMEALSKHANIEPVITVTGNNPTHYLLLCCSVSSKIPPVWNELEKENREFFEAYSQSHNKDRATEAEASTMIQKLMLDQDHTKDSKNE